MIMIMNNLWLVEANNRLQNYCSITLLSHENLGFLKKVSTMTHNPAEKKSIEFLAFVRLNILEYQRYSNILDFLRITWRYLPLEYSRIFMKFQAQR